MYQYHQFEHFWPIICVRMWPVNASGHLQHNIESLKESVSHQSMASSSASVMCTNFHSRLKKHKGNQFARKLSRSTATPTHTSASLSSSIGARQHVMDDCCGWLWRRDCHFRGHHPLTISHDVNFSARLRCDDMCRGGAAILNTLRPTLHSHRLW